MSEINVAVLTALADKEMSDELASFGVTDLAGVNDELSTLINDAFAEERANANKAAARDIVALIKESNTEITANVQELRAVRRREAAISNRIANINRARAYGLETKNFIPLMVALGLRVPASCKPELLQIPEGWQPKSDVKKPAAATKKA